MATRSKGRNLLRRALCFLVAALGALLLTLSAFTQYRQGMANSARAFYNQEWFLPQLALDTYALNWRAQQQWQGKNMQPSALYCPDEEKGTVDQRNAVDQTIWGAETFFESEMDGMDWELVGPNGERYSNLKIELSGYWQDGAITSAGAQKYQYFLVLQFDENGSLRPQGFYGGDRTYAENEHQNRLWQFEMEEYDLDRLVAQDTDLEVSYDEQGPTVQLETRPPTGITIYYAVPRVVDVDSGIYYSIYYAEGDVLVDAGFGNILALILGGVGIIALLLCASPWLRAVDGGHRTSFERSAAGLLLVLFATSGCIELALFTARGDLARWLSLFFTEEEMITWISRSILFGANLLLLGGMAACAAGLSGIFVMGPRQYFATRSWIVGKFITLWRWATRVDLTEPGTKTLLRLLAVNFVILSVCCTIWVFGIFALLVYSVILFFLLYRRYQKIRHDYSQLTEAVGRMAEGELEFRVEEDLGIFNPLKEKLGQVQSGFKAAVETELKSRSLKTELITNVSHDLKTPLTAIVTYVDLLKDENLSPQTRAEYVETLERKAQRLKQLIEDLFEISKAASGNVTFAHDRVDLVQLLQQVHYELEDKIAASGIDFRWDLPAQPVILELDGQRSCRIFENLIVNITKYGLAGTRAYIRLTAQPDQIVVTLKNVSAQELDFDPERITDRFVRGDRARTGEGSGLGLAIAKSFTELQGGRFEILIDGDLFTARLSWPRAGLENE